MNIFLSYTRKDSDLAERIAETLRFMGIVVWMDKDNLEMGILQELDIINIIERYDGIISLITPNSVESDYVILELKSAFKIMRRKKDYLIIPLIQKISFEELKIWGLEKLGENMSSFSGHSLKEHVFDEHLTEFAEGVLGSLLRVHDELSNLTRITIQLFSKEEQILLDETNFVFNFISLIDDIDKIITSKIQHSYNCIKTSREIFSKSIHTKSLFIINPKCHITLSVAFGFIFRQTSGYRLKIKYFESTFDTDERYLPLENELSIEENSGSIQQNPIIFEISISNDVRAAVSELISSDVIDYRKRIHISPSSGSSRTIAFDNELANQYAIAIARSIRVESLEHIDCSILLLMSSPLFMSFLIGWNLNASGEIQLYEFQNFSKTYYPSYQLE